MSVPASLRVGPFTSTVLVKKSYLILYFFLMWVSIVPILFELWWYWNFLYYWKPIYFYIFLPILFFIIYLTMVFTSLLFAKLLLVIINKINRPKEGVFLRDTSDKDYRYWSLRNTVKKWPVWLSHKFPFPFLDNICFKMFGVKTKFNNSLFEGWVDCEFVEFGKNVVVGQASIIQSSVIIGNMLIIRKTIIDDNVRIGAHTIVMPGTHIKKNSVLAASSVTTVGQELEEGWVYVGVPAQKFKQNRFFEDNLEKVLGKVEDVDTLKKKYEEMYIKRTDTHQNLKERIHLRKELKEEVQRRKEKAIKEVLNQTNTIKKEEVNLQYHWYLFSFFIIYYGSIILPGVILMLYLGYIFFPLFLGGRSFVSLLLGLNPILIIILTPLVIITCYVIHLLLVGFITHHLWAITEKKISFKSWYNTKKYSQQSAKLLSY